jgi:RNase P subunit RPR2
VSVGFITDGQPIDEGDLDVVRCTNQACRSLDLKIRTSTTQRIEGGRPLVVVLCLACGHTWKVIGTAPVRALVVRRQHTAAPSRRT